MNHSDHEGAKTRRDPSSRPVSFASSCLRGLLVLFVDLYRALARPFMPPACRFHPSCGDYARQAVLAHGAGAGLLLSARRLARCHPFHPGGPDPVPAHPVRP